MKIRHPLLQKTLGLLAATAFNAVRRTIDCRATYFDPTAAPYHPRTGRNMYLGWHEYMLLPGLVYGTRRIAALTSAHSDGDIITGALRHLGFDTVRGSTNRGGVAALLRMLRRARHHLTVTPDGPRGPRRTMSVGAVFLASRLGMPVVCIGYGFDRPWRAASWDRFAVPRPFSRARAIAGPRLHVPPDADRDTLEAYRAYFERLLNWLTEEAERWAADGRRRAGQTELRPLREMPPSREAPAPGVPTLPPELAAEWAALAAPKRAAA
jgi:lysophospholipid acyltransferase (LPLAT)-like uncharacterized protein